MRLLYISPSYYPAFKYGGPIVSTHLVNKTLVSKGIQVHVITSLAGLEERQDIQSGKWVDVDGVRVMYLPYYGYEHYTFSPEIFWKAWQLIPAYHLVHINAVWNFPVLCGSVASCLRRKPYVISPRGTIYQEAVNLRSSVKKKIYYHLIARHYLARADAIHFTSENERNEVTGYLGLKNQAFVVPNGVDLGEFINLPLKGTFKEKHEILRERPYLLFLGRINIKKGLDILVKSFEKLVFDFPDLCLVIAGPDNEGYADKVKSLLMRAGLLPRVVFPGMLTGENKLAAIVDAECFVLPSYSENFGMAVVEAMACETAVVISNMVGIREDVEKEDAGIVVETNPESLYDGIKALMKNPDMKHRIAQNGKRLVMRRYDINGVAEMIINAYEEILRRHGLK